MRNALPYLALILIVSCLAFLLLYKQPHQFDARITLSYRDKIPYGTYAAYNLLSKEFPKAVVEINRYAPGEWRSLSHDSSKQVLLIITKFFNPSEDELDYLTGLVQKNNFVFISTLQMNLAARKFFKLHEKHSFSPYAPYVNMHPFNPFDTLIVNLDDKTFASPFSFQYPGAYFSNEFTKTDSLFTFHLGYASSSKPDLAAINSKTGTIFLHAAPVAFTNFFLLYNDNHNYFEKLMSLLPADAKKIVWDEYFLYKRSSNQDTERQGVLSVILRYPNFRWAFWIVLALISIYILTEIKRRQRIIPPHEKPVNDSLEFVTTIGKLYYEKGDHKNLAEKLIQYFLDHVRNKFKISTAEINSTFVQQLAAKSNKDISEINAITNSIHTIQLSNTITQKQLMEFYELLENFYTKT